MIGNKADLVKKRQVEYAEAKEFADANSLVFLELSAKNYKEVEEAFKQTAEEIGRKLKQNGRAQEKGIKLGGSSTNSGATSIKSTGSSSGGNANKKRPINKKPAGQECC